MVSFELHEVRAGLGGLVQSNEADLAGCAGHSFFPLNTRIYNSNYACRACGGVVDHLTAAPYLARERAEAEMQAESDRLDREAAA